MTACSCWPRCPPGARTETPGQACLRGFGLGDPGDARSRAAFAVDGCVPMSSRCRMSNSDDLAPFGSAHGYLGVRFAASPAKGRACLFGPCEVGTSAPGPARNGRGRETRYPPGPRCLAKPPGRMDARRIGGRRGGGDKFGKAEKLVLRERIELSTSPLPMECSTTELPQQVRRPGRVAVAVRRLRAWRRSEAAP